MGSVTIGAASEPGWNAFGGLRSERSYISLMTCDSEKVWPEQEEAHEHRRYWLDKGEEDLEASEERAHSLNQPCRLVKDCERSLNL